MTREEATERVQSGLNQQQPAGLTISDWVATEFASALSVKIRTNPLGLEDRAKAADLFARLKADSLTVVPVTREHFALAARFADQHGIGLQAGDALQIAVAAALGGTISTLDKRLVEAAIALGVSAEMI